MGKTIKEKKNDFDKDTSKNTFSHPYINYISNKDYKKTDNLIPRTISWKCLFPMPKCV